MNNLKKKIVASVLGLSMVVMLAPGITEGLTAEELQAQINALMAQLATLQAQLATLEGTTTTATPTVTGCTITSFDRNLKLGMTGDDVKCLQIVLNSDTATQLAASGVGSSGNETSYFGPLTKAAVVKFQEKYASEVLASYGLTAGTGFVGSTTRAKLNSLLTAAPVVPVVPAGCTCTDWVSGACGAGTCTAAQRQQTRTCTPAAGAAADACAAVATTQCVADATCAAVPTTGLTVALAPDTPPAATLVSGQNGHPGTALIPFLKVVITSSKDVKVKELKITRSGVSTDSDLGTIYLYEGPDLLAEANLVSKVASFYNAVGLFTIPAGGKKTLDIKADLVSNISGKTISLGIMSASDVVPIEEIEVKGDYPIQGSTFNVAKVDDLGEMDVTNISGGMSSVDPDTAGFQVLKFRANATKQNLAISYLKVTEIGTIKVEDLKNFKLLVNGEEVATLEKMNSDYTLTFDLSSAPITIEKGDHKDLVLKADVITGAGKEFKFTVQKTTDLLTNDLNYQVYVIPKKSGSTWSPVAPTKTSINAGSLTVSKSSEYPIGDIVLKGKNVFLAAFDFKATGEDIKVSSLKLDGPGALVIDSGNKTIVVNNEADCTTEPISKTLTEGTYTGSELAAALQAKIREVTELNRTEVTYDGTSGKFSVHPKRETETVGAVCFAHDNTTLDDVVKITTNITDGTKKTGDVTMPISLKNGKLMVDGVQVAGLQNIYDSTEYTFGTSFIVPGGKTKVLKVYADIEKVVAGETSWSETAPNNKIKIGLEGGTDNAQAQTTLGLISTSAVSGTALTIKAVSLIYNPYSAYADPKFTPGTKGAKIGSFVVNAGGAEGVNVDKVILDLGLGGNMAIGSLENLKISVSDEVIASPKTDNNEFTAVKLSLAANQSKVVDVFVDIKDAAVADNTVQVTVDEASGTGAETGKQVEYTTDVALQTATVKVAAIASGYPKIVTKVPSDIVLAGKSDVVMAKFTFKALYEDFTVKYLDINVPSDAKEEIAAIKLSYDGKTTDPVPLSSAPDAIFDNQTFKVPAGQEATVAVLADLAKSTAADGSATSGTKLKVTLDEWIAWSTTGKKASGTDDVNGEDMVLYNNEPIVSLNATSPTGKVITAWVSDIEVMKVDVAAARDTLTLKEITVKPDFTGTLTGDKGIAVKVGTKEIGRIMDTSDSATYTEGDTVTAGTAFNIGTDNIKKFKKGQIVDVGMKDANGDTASVADAEITEVNESAGTIKINKDLVSVPDGADNDETVTATFNPSGYKTDKQYKIDIEDQTVDTTGITLTILADTTGLGATDSYRMWLTAENDSNTYQADNTKKDFLWNDGTGSCNGYLILYETPIKGGVLSK